VDGLDAFKANLSQVANQIRSIEAVFLDVRDTLGEVDAPGNFLPYRPSTEQLLDALRQLKLRIGAITSLPDEWKHEDAIKVIRNAVLSQDTETGKLVTIGDFIASEDIISNQEAGAAKPDPKIYEYAARKFGLNPEACLFVGENLIEVIGAQNAGMQVQQKQCPPGRDFAPALVARIGASPIDSGRQFQALLEHEHLLGERIFACGDRIAVWISKLISGWTPKLDQKGWESPPRVEMPEALERAMACFIFLLDRFANQVHLHAEEKMLEVAVACGMPPEKGQWVFDQHDQARAYWAALDIAWRRIKQGMTMTGGSLSMTFRRPPRHSSFSLRRMPSGKITKRIRSQVRCLVILTTLWS